MRFLRIKARKLCLIEYRNLGERGFGSLFFAALVLPVIFCLLVLSLDLAAFFHVREQVRDLLDEEAIESLRRGQQSSNAIQSVRSRLERVSGFINNVSVSADVSSRDAILSIDADYPGIVTPLGAALLGEKVKPLPMQLSVKARRFRSVALILLDRHVSSETSVCSDPDFIAVKNFVATLRSAFDLSGFEKISLAVVPGLTRDVDILDPSQIYRGCDDTSVTGALEWKQLPGHAGGLPAVHRVIEVVEEFVSSAREYAQPERIAVIGVTRGATAGNGYLYPVLDALEGLSRYQTAELSFLHLAVSPAGFSTLPVDSAFKQMVRRREVKVESSMIADPALVAASVGYLGSDAVISW